MVARLASGTRMVDFLLFDKHAFLPLVLLPSCLDTTRNKYPYMQYSGFAQTEVSNRVARFFLVQTYQNGPNIANYTNRPYIIPNGRKTFQMVINIQTFFILRPSKIYPNLDFWFQTNHLATLVSNSSG
jgi:hypothetical protein